jgi:hypothetical protein
MEHIREIISRANSHLENETDSDQQRRVEEIKRIAEEVMTIGTGLPKRDLDLRYQLQQLEERIKQLETPKEDPIVEEEKETSAEEIKPKRSVVDKLLGRNK